MDIKDSVAGFAPEVVVVLGGDRCMLIAIRHPQNSDRGHDSIFKEAIHDAVHGPQTETWCIHASELVYLLYR